MMGRGEAGRANRIALLVVLVLGAVPPLLHVWISYFPPLGYVPTGMGTGDSGHHLIAMRALASGFYSPFVLEGSAHDWRVFATPFLLLYALVGEVGRWSGLPEFLFLGVVNGAAGAVYLWQAWRFLRVVAPRVALRAFLLFALGGGLGGVAWWGCQLAGATQAAGFEESFLRLAWYGLIEGQSHVPFLHFWRLYYTVPLAFGLAACVALFQTLASGCGRHLVFAMFLAGMAGFWNPRLGPMLLLIVLLHPGCRAALWGGFGRRFVGGFCGALVVGAGLGAGLMALHPVYAVNVAGVTAGTLHLLPFVAAAGPLLLLGMIWSVWHRPVGLVVGGLAGYFVVYVLAVLAYTIYYGNWLHGGDTGAAVVASRWGLLGLVAGGILGWAFRRRRGEGGAVEPVGDWCFLWFLAFFFVASGAGGGLWLAFAPQRWMVLMGLPLAVLAAGGVEWFGPGARRVLVFVVCMLGVSSLLVSALYFQGPLGVQGPGAPFRHLHYELMTEADAELLAALPPGRVILPPWSPIAFGEIVALRPDTLVLGGPGALNIGNQPFGLVQRDVQDFWSAARPHGEIVARWGIQHVFVPPSGDGDWPVLRLLDLDPSFRRVAVGSGGRLYTVVEREAMP